ncbi:MAG: Maltodextrin phosphorylase [Syntrophorhabdaceae bacterium PtaU1.Bin034]|nr:MAG: Maltodextrin phosphorylase [Syntrophorhabdaceae bacterium PtaU1.Bin034]
MNRKAVIAYFPMEIALDPEMPTYSGGLGVLAGDTVRSAADLGIPMVAVTLLYRKGYFYQKLDEGRQVEEPVQWAIDDYLEELPERAMVRIEGRRVYIRPWCYWVEGVTGCRVAVYFLDSDLPENSEEDRRITDYLYGGDQRYRLCQEVILGFGGVRILSALGYDGIRRYHMNEGHAAFLAVELFTQHAKKSGRTLITGEDIAAVREKCIFTTHTPVPAGHDQFPVDLVSRVIEQRKERFDLKDVSALEVVRRVLNIPKEVSDFRELLNPQRRVNMTLLALNSSHYVNGVAKQHGEIARLMFAEYVIHSITNGVHATTWTSEHFRRLYDSYIPGWRQDPFSLRYALSIPKEEVWDAHMEAKKGLIEYVNRDTNTGLKTGCLTIGFARRVTAYKRPDLIFSDPERLKKVAENAGPLQLVFSGKAHPQDGGGKEIIARIWQMKEALRDSVKVAYLPNYDMSLGRMITSGVDVWLNTPEPPMEASGTSGMKAALNGVPSLSILDGWWIEGWIEGVTGWSIGEDPRHRQDGPNSSKDATSLYDKLEGTIIPLFYKDNARFIDIMRHCIALNGSFFNTHRMMQQYVMNAYFI